MLRCTCAGIYQFIGPVDDVFALLRSLPYQRSIRGICPVSQAPRFTSVYLNGCHASGDGCARSEIWQVAHVGCVQVGRLCLSLGQKRLRWVRHPSDHVYVNEQVVLQGLSLPRHRTMDTMEVDDPLYAKLFARAPIYDLVFCCLSPRSLVRLALTCRAAYLAVAAFKNRAFNINRHFSRYFNDPVSFRSLQANTNTLVSGSDALQFLDRTFYPESDLDLYTHPGHSFELARFLVDAEGYHFAPCEQQEEDWKVAIGSNWDGTEPRMTVVDGNQYPMAGITAVWTFEKTSTNQQCLKIQIIEAASSPLEAIFQFHSSMSSSVSMLSRVLTVV